MLHAEQHEPSFFIVRSNRSLGPQRLGCNLDGLATYQPSYSAITWAPSSSTRAPNSTLNKTATAVVNEP